MCSCSLRTRGLGGSSGLVGMGGGLAAVAGAGVGVAGLLGTLGFAPGGVRAPLEGGVLVEGWPLLPPPPRGAPRTGPPRRPFTPRGAATGEGFEGKPALAPKGRPSEGWTVGLERVRWTAAAGETPPRGLAVPRGVPPEGGLIWEGIWGRERPVPGLAVVVGVGFSAGTGGGVDAWGVPLGFLEREGEKVWLRRCPPRERREGLSGKELRFPDVCERKRFSWRES